MSNITESLGHIVYKITAYGEFDKQGTQRLCTIFVTAENFTKAMAKVDAMGVVHVFHKVEKVCTLNHFTLAHSDFVKGLAEDGRV